MKTHTVEVLITVAQLDDAVFTGEYVLRALAADGVVLHEIHEEVTELDAATSDYARLITLTVVLERLHGKLQDGKAWYVLRVLQTSKNVDGWLARGWKRNAETVKELAGAVDLLLKPFPAREFVKLSREELDSCLQTREGVMRTA